MARRIRCLLVAVLFLAMGGHLAVVQSIAWARMTLKFSSQDSLPVSLRKTLDGRHPCSLCLKVKKAARGTHGLAALQWRDSPDALTPSTFPQLTKRTLAWRVGVRRDRSPAHWMSIDSPPPEYSLS